MRSPSSFRRSSWQLLACWLLVAIAGSYNAGAVVAEDAPQAAAAEADIVKARENAVNRAVEFLRAKGQSADGSYSSADWSRYYGADHDGLAPQRSNGSGSVGGQKPQISGRLRAARWRHLSEREPVK